MANLSDNFDADPSSNWTAEISTATWDSGAGEYDVDTVNGDALIRHNSTTGAFNHESQCTGLASATARLPLVAVRTRSGTDDFYGACLQEATGILIYRYEAGTRVSLIASPAPTITAGNWYTLRVAASGADGANVELDIWITDHGASKPSDPGWIGVDASPTYEATDAEANRLDDSSLHLGVGIGGRTGGADFDTRNDFWKARNISDRGAGPRKIIIGPKP